MCIRDRDVQHVGVGRHDLVEGGPDAAGEVRWDRDDEDEQDDQHDGDAIMLVVLLVLVVAIPAHFTGGIGATFHKIMATHPDMLHIPVSYTHLTLPTILRV